MNPRQSELGMPLVTHLVTAFNLFIGCDMEEEGLELCLVYLYSGYFGLTTLSPLPQPPFGTIFEIELSTEKQNFFFLIRKLCTRRIKLSSEA